MLQNVHFDPSNTPIKNDFENSWRTYSFEYKELAENISLSDFGYWKALQAYKH